MKICVVPIDNRPVCYNLIKDICDVDSDIELFIPPREYLGDLTKNADYEKIIDWLNNIPKTDVMVLSLDTIAYGGLIPSRRSLDTIEDIKNRINKIKHLLVDNRVYAFSSIMRISNNNFNEEEKEYWKDYGKKIFEYSYNCSKYGSFETDVPNEIIEDYLKTRKRNFEINKMYLDWQKEGLFDTLIFSKDDCAEFGFNVDEAIELEKLGGKTKTGADEIPLTLIAGAMQKNIKVFVKYTEPNYKDRISNYEDVSIEKSVLGQLELGGFSVVEEEKDSDIVLVVNNFIEKQGELVMGWDTQPFSSVFTTPQKPFAVADVRFANGADNEFVHQILKKETYPQYGYSGWNTSANSLGSLLAGIKVKYNAKVYNNRAWQKLQAIRLLDDWGYQANVRKEINYPDDISEKMKQFEQIIFDVLDIKLKYIYPRYIYPKYIYPWNRKFEIEVVLETISSMEKI